MKGLKEIKKDNYIAQLNVGIPVLAPIHDPEWIEAMQAGGEGVECILISIKEFNRLKDRDYRLEGLEK